MTCSSAIAASDQRCCDWSIFYLFSFKLCLLCNTPTALLKNGNPELSCLFSISHGCNTPNLNDQLLRQLWSSIWAILIRVVWRPLTLSLNIFTNLLFAMERRSCLLVWSTAWHYGMLLFWALLYCCLLQLHIFSVKRS